LSIIEGGRASSKDAAHGRSSPTMFRDCGHPAGGFSLWHAALIFVLGPRPARGCLIGPLPFRVFFLIVPRNPPTGFDDNQPRRDHDLRWLSGYAAYLPAEAAAGRVFGRAPCPPSRPAIVRRVARRRGISSAESKSGLQGKNQPVWRRSCFFFLPQRACLFRGSRPLQLPLIPRPGSRGLSSPPSPPPPLSPDRQAGGRRFSGVPVHR